MKTTKASQDKFAQPQPIGLLAPYLTNEQSLRLAISVISALAPSKIPKNGLELKRFGDLMI